MTSKISDLLGVKKDALNKELENRHFLINIAEKDDILNKPNNINEDVLSNIERLDNISKVDDGQFKYSGDKKWHDLVNYMIKNGFSQDPEFDKLCGSNSYKSISDSNDGQTK